MRSFILGACRYQMDEGRLDGILEKLKTSDPRMHGLLSRKMEEIIQFPEHYKPLSGKMAGLRRAHIGTNNILTYSIDYRERKVIFQDFGSFDDIYH